MKTAKPTVVGTMGVMAASLLVTACDKPRPEDAARIRVLQKEVEELQRDKIPRRELEELKAENQTLRINLQQMEANRERARAAERELAELQVQLSSAKEKRSESGADSVTKARESALGQTIPSLTCADGEVYQNVTIRSITDHQVKIRHEGGMATLRAETVPIEWVTRFNLTPEPAPEEPAPTPASAEKSLASTPAPTTAAGKAIAPEMPAPTAAVSPASAAPAANDETARKVMPVVVIIEGDVSTGSGFLVRQGISTYLYTAAHVLSGNNRLTVKTSDGRKFTKFGVFEVADGYDLARLELTEEIESAATLSDSSPLVIGHPVFAIGNSGGGGVLTVLKGAVTGVGPAEFEVDATIIQGNSGGPVFDATTGKVMGVVTRALAAREDIWAAETRFSGVRRFAGRLDGRIRWHRIAIGSFLAERRQMDEMDRGTRLLFALSMLRPTVSGLRMNTAIKEGVTAVQVFGENKDQQAVKDLVDMNTVLQSRGVNLSERDLLKKFANFYRQILWNAQKQSKAFAPVDFSPYHRKEAEQSVKWRANAEAAVNSQLDNMLR